MSGSRNLNVHQIMEQLNGSPQYLGTIQSAGTNVISNLSSAIRAGDRLLVQPDAAGYVLAADAAASPSTTNSSTTGLKLLADEKCYLTLAGASTPGKANNTAEAYLQWISASGTTNLKVWRLI